MSRLSASHAQCTIGTTFPAFILSQCAAIFLPAAQAYAVQPHGGAEGLISHQLGHFLFTFAMVVLLFRIGRAQFSGPGWREFKGFLWLIIFWNILTFSGHWMHNRVPSGHFIRQNNHIIGFQVTNAFDLIFYLTRLDHLLLVPAFFLLLLAIRNWGRKV